MRGVVYRYTINDKYYIGKTLMEERKRQAKHKYEALTKKADTPFAKAIRKYGWNNVLNSYEVLEEFNANTKEELQNILCEKETYYIIKYNSLVPNGYNIYAKGQDHFMKGYANKEDMYEKISNSLKGKYLNNQNSRKVYCVELDKWFPSVSQAGRDLNIPQCDIQKVCTGVCSTAKGYRFTYDKNKIPEYKRATQEIRCIELDKTFDSVRHATEYFDLPYNKRGELKKAIQKGWRFHGYHWEKTGKLIPCYYKRVL